jgi:hypothetical protein
MAVVRICQLGELDDLASLIAELRPAAAENGSLPQSPRATPGKKNAAPNEVKVAAVGMMPHREIEGTGIDRTAARPADAPHQSSAGIHGDVSAGPSVQPLTDSHAEALWRLAVLELGDTLAGSAAHAERVTAAGDNLLVASFPSAYRFCRDICDRPEPRARLERLLTDAHGRPIRLKLELHDDAPAEAPISRTASPSRRARLAEVGELPFVRRAMELFDVPIGQLRYTPPEGER